LWKRDNLIKVFFEDLIFASEDLLEKTMERERRRFDRVTTRWEEEHHPLWDDVLLIRDDGNHEGHHPYWRKKRAFNRARYRWDYCRHRLESSLSFVRMT
jgi:hypothetical protein